MLTIDQARQLTDGEPDIVELLRGFEEVDRYYREVVAAMNTPEKDIVPVLNSAEVTVSFQPAPFIIDLSQTDR